MLMKRKRLYCIGGTQDGRIAEEQFGFEVCRPARSDFKLWLPGDEEPSFERLAPAREFYELRTCGKDGFCVSFWVMSGMPERDFLTRAMELFDEAAVLADEQYLANEGYG